MPTRYRLPTVASVFCVLWFGWLAPMAARGDSPPSVIKQVAAKYPWKMVDAGLEGEVVVEFIVDKNGNVRNAFAAASNNPWFEREAIEAIEQWKFKPGIKDGRPVNTSRVQVPVKFSLIGPSLQWQVNKGKDHDTLPEEYRW